VEPYDDFTGRSRQEEYHADHMPSRAAVELYLEREYPEFDSDQIKALSGKVAAVIVPVEVHRKISATYGGVSRLKRNMIPMMFAQQQIKILILKYQH